MAVRFDAVGDALYLSQPAGDTVPSSAAVTYGGILTLVSDINAAGALLLAVPNGSSVFCGLSIDSTGTGLQIDTSGSDSASTTLVVGQRYRFAYRKDGSAHTMFLDGASSQTLTQAIVADTTPALLIGGNGSSNYCNVRLEDIWCADSALTDDQIAHMNLRSVPPINLWEWWPMRRGITRTRGLLRNRSLRELGTLTDEDSGPTPWGAPVLYVNNPAPVVAAAMFNPLSGRGGAAAQPLVV